MHRTLLVGITTVIATAAAFWWSHADGQTQERVTPIPSSVSQTPKDSRPVKPLMQAKLNHAQQVLEGLVTQDFDQVEASAKALKRMSLDPPAGWQKKNTDGEVYEHFRMEFMRQSAQLEQMASEKNLAGAAWYQQNLTSTCISCHNYIRDAGESN